jgi:drug/metabolite transporter (DMT)-like permease
MRCPVRQPSYSNGVKVAGMTQKLSPATALMLTVPPLLWAGNAVVGRLVSDLVPPITLNFLRWSIAFFILLPLAGNLLKPSSPLWPSWRRFAVLSLLGVGCYNALQYLALQTSTPLNVTLVAGSTPFFMLAIGALFFKTPVRPAQWLGAALSIVGVLVVLSRGNVEQLMQVSFVVGDIYILLATLCWALYSWLLSQRNEPDEIRSNWAAFLMAQVIFGLGWAGMFTGAEWALTDAHITWGPPLFAALAFVSVGPAVLAYRCWGLGVQTAGPAVAGFFSNLTPLFAAIMSTVFLGDLPKVYHVVAFGLIVSGILVSSHRPKQVNQ